MIHSHASRNHPLSPSDPYHTHLSPIISSWRREKTGSQLRDTTQRTLLRRRNEENDQPDGDARNNLTASPDPTGILPRVFQVPPPPQMRMKRFVPSPSRPLTGHPENKLLSVRKWSGGLGDSGRANTIPSNPFPLPLPLSLPVAQSAFGPGAQHRRCLRRSLTFSYAVP